MKTRISLLIALLAIMITSCKKHENEILPVRPEPTPHSDVPVFTLGTTTAVIIDESTPTIGNNGGSYSISFTATAPTDDDLFINTPAMVPAGTFPVTKTTPGVGGDLSVVVTMSGPESHGIALVTWEKIPAGTTRTITVSGYISHGGTAGSTGIKLEKINWTTHETGAYTSAVTLVNYSSSEVYITSKRRRAS